MGYFVPKTLYKLNNWGLWKFEDGKKVPYSPKYNGRASVDKLYQWGSYGAAVNKLEYTDDYCGLGFLLNKKLGLVFIDLDHCIDEDSGELTPLAENIINAFSGTYIEYSQSGHGLHIICKGEIPINGKKISSKGFEIYQHARYIAFTGNAYEANEPTYKQKELDKLCKYFAIEAETTRDNETPQEPTTTEEDEAILKRCEKWQDFTNLYYNAIFPYKNKKGEPDTSTADYRLAFILYNCCNGNREQAERLFLQSELAKREKCKRDDYIKITFDRLTKIPYEPKRKKLQQRSEPQQEQPTRYIRNDETTKDGIKIY